MAKYLFNNSNLNQNKQLPFGIISLSVLIFLSLTLVISLSFTSHYKKYIEFQNNYVDLEDNFNKINQENSEYIQTVNKLENQFISVNDEIKRLKQEKFLYGKIVSKTNKFIEYMNKNDIDSAFKYLSNNTKIRDNKIFFNKDEYWSGNFKKNIFPGTINLNKHLNKLEFVYFYSDNKSQDGIIKYGFFEFTKNNEDWFISNIRSLYDDSSVVTELTSIDRQMYE